MTLLTGRRTMLHIDCCKHFELPYLWNTPFTRRLSWLKHQRLCRLQRLLLAEFQGGIVAGGQKCHDNKDIEGPGVAAREFTQLASGTAWVMRSGELGSKWVQSVRSTHKDGHRGCILVLYSSNIIIYILYIYNQILKYICNYIIIYI